MLRVNMPDGKAVYFGRANTSDPFTSASPDVHGQIVENQDGTYTLTFKDGGSHKFDSGGALLWQKDRNGNQTTLGYDASGFLSTITDSFGRTLTLNKNSSNGKVSSIVYDSQTIASYEYASGTDRLETVTYQESSKFQFSYDTINGKTYLTTVRDALGNILEDHDYDSEGRAVTSVKDGGVESYIFDYSVPGKTKVTDGNNNVSYFHFNKTRGKNVIERIQGLCGCGSGSEITNFEYDSIGKVVRKTDALGKVTRYKYDNNGNVTEIVYEMVENGIQTSIKHKYTYNSLGEVLTFTDGMNGVTTNTYDSRGNLLTTTDPLNNTTTATYTSSGLPATVTDARGNTTTIDHDSHGRLDHVTDALENETSFNFDARARLTSLTNAKNETTSFTYDTRDRLKKITYPDSNFVTYNYDLAGRRISMTDERGNPTTYAFDNAYRLTGITDALSHTATFGYDAMSRLISQTDALGNTTDYRYDSFDRLDKITYPAAAIGATRLYEEFVYNDVGNLIQKIDTAGRTTSFHYDDLHRVDYVTDALNNTTYFIYNHRSQTTKVKDALNQEYTFAYDALGRMLSQTRAGTTMSYEYNEVGDLKKRTDHNGQVTDYTYDALNRLTHIAYADSTNFATYGYDELSRLTSAQNQNGTVTMGYNNRGWLNTTTDVHDHAVEYSYDPAGNRTHLELDNDIHATYEYDAADRLITLTDEAPGDYTFAYDNADRLITKTLPNNIVTSYTYDGMGRLTRLKHQLSSAVLFDNQYTYNAASQISQITDPAKTRVFSYDNIDRLTGVSVSGNPVESYAYDGVGNRTSSHLNSFFNLDPFNRLTGTDAFNYSLDPNGNLINKTVYQDPGGIIVPTTDGTRHTWDEESRLIETTVQLDGQSTSTVYEYDALGRRVKRAVGLNETKFTYDGMDVVMDEERGNEVTYQNAPGIDNKLKLSNEGSPNYLLQDHLGSTVVVTKGSGSVVASTDYDSFGNATNGSFMTRYQYTGRERDDLSGLIYYRARWYDPQVGRFISEDPIGFAGGDINLYGYVWNNPQNLTDPMGLSPNDDVERFKQSRWEVEQALIEALENPINFIIGFGDEASLGGTRYIRQLQGIDDPNLDCYAAYQAGGWTAFGVQMVQGGLGIYKGGAKIMARRLRAPKFKPFTRENFRDNLKLLTGENPPSNIHAHHVLPQKFGPQFARAGINIHEPRYGAWWEAQGHWSNAGSYNSLWAEFLQSNPGRQAIHDFGREASIRFGIAVNY
jgi:RHS repeat-associated protein